MSERWLEKINLAILASDCNNPAHCRCDHSVGMAPCESCAIRDALIYTKKQLISTPDFSSALEKARPKFEGGFSTMNVGYSNGFNDGFRAGFDAAKGGEQ